MPTTPEIGTPTTIAIDGENVRVEVCGVDERHGIRVTNRQWGGTVSTWVQANDLTTTA